VAAVITIVDQSRSLVHLFTVETSIGAIVVLYFNEDSLRAMERALVGKVESQGLRLGRAEIDGETLSECIPNLAREWVTAEGHCISDDDPLWPRLLAGILRLRELPLTGPGDTGPAVASRRSRRR
jgi:hypothetical protein